MNTDTLRELADELTAKEINSRAFEIAKKNKFTPLSYNAVYAILNRRNGEVPLVVKDAIIQLAKEKVSRINKLFRDKN